MEPGLKTLVTPLEFRTILIDDVTMQWVNAPDEVNIWRFDEWPWLEIWYQFGIRGMQHATKTHTVAAGLWRISFTIETSICLAIE